MTKRKRNPVTTDALARRLIRMGDDARSDTQTIRLRILDLNQRMNAFQEQLDHQDRKLTTIVDKLERISEGVWAVRSASAKDLELIKEVNAHMWQTQNRLGAVRDILTGTYTVTRPAPPRMSLMEWFRKRMGL